MIHQIDIERDLNGEPVKIEARCKVPAWPNPVVAINFLKNGKRWTVGTSTALPTDIDSAMMVLACQSEAFKTLEEIKSNETMQLKSGLSLSPIKSAPGIL